MTVKKYPYLRRAISDSCENNILFERVKKTELSSGVGILPNYISQIWEYNCGQVEPKLNNSHKIEVFPMGADPFISSGRLKFLLEDEE